MSHPSSMATDDDDGDRVASVDDVLSFWFEGDLDELYKRKWFPAGDKTGRMQRAVDEAISVRFGATLRAAEAGDLDSWATASPSSAVALVLVLDQFARHVYRHDEDRDVKVAANDARAVVVTEGCIEKGWDARVTVPQAVFLLMPFRHTQRTVPRLREALDALDRRREEDAARAELLGKFRKTTLRCLQDLEGKQHRDGDEILEHHEFVPDEAVMAGMTEHPVYRTVERFLRARLSGDARVTSKRSEQSPRDEPKSVAISLSGGVDSMALATMLKHMAPRFGNIDVVAIHIDYANRPESGAEAAFVEEWCKRMGIVCVIRRIAEVKRGVTPREQYEAESRAIRYNLYKECARTYKFPAVFVGHHEGDVQENVIANLMRGANLLAVNGMAEEGIVEGVRIWRPMLPHPKDPIIEFAHKYGVPYFLVRQTSPVRRHTRASVDPSDDAAAVTFLQML